MDLLIGLDNGLEGIFLCPDSPVQRNRFHVSDLVVRIIGDAIPHYFHPFVCLGIGYAGLTRGRELLGAFPVQAVRASAAAPASKSVPIFFIVPLRELEIKMLAIML